MNLVTSILEKLVSFPVLGGQSNLSILDYIKQLLEKEKIPYQLVPNENGDKASLHCRIGPPVDGGVILSGHMDVVPVAGQQWDTDPFQMTLKDGKWYGRGTCDMKGFLACCLASIETFKSARLRVPVYFAFSYDEEIGCLGAPDLIQAIKSHYQEVPKYALIGEPSMMQPIVGQKGIGVMETCVNGTAGHSSRIRQEVSAIHEAARLVSWLEDKMDSLIQQGQLDDRFQPPHTSVHVGTIKGGIAPNVIADDVVFQWDIRTIPKDSIKDILRDFKFHCNQREIEVRKMFPGFQIKTTMYHPAVPPLDTPADASVVELVKKLTGIHELQTVAYAAEAGQFAEGGFEAIICGPGDIAQAHRANEFIAVDQLEKGMEMMKRLALHLSA